jgi:hypothetical protein
MSVGTPSPSVEVPATFYTHGSAISFSNGFGDPAAVHGLTTDLHFVGDGQALGSNYSIRSVPLAEQSRVRQTVINDARVRYSGVMPSAGHFVHASGRPHVEREATESISQWSQWLKSGVLILLMFVLLIIFYFSMSILTTLIILCFLICARSQICIVLTNQLQNQHMFIMMDLNQLLIWCLSPNPHC